MPGGVFHSGMQELIDLYRHNTWANAKVFDVALGCGRELQERVQETLTHLVRVEHAYLAMMLQRPPEDREQFARHDLAWFGLHVQELGTEYLQLIGTIDADDLRRDMRIPWFDFPVTVRDGLLQVLSHSAQHRSQVLSALSTHGVETPDLDYVLMLQEGGAQ
jgi:uncharacterized damage-inducible protein DinB